jgi:hypothetical protein
MASWSGGGEGVSEVVESAAERRHGRRSDRGDRRTVNFLSDPAEDADRLRHTPPPRVEPMPHGPPR